MWTSAICWPRSRASSSFAVGRCRPLGEEFQKKEARLKKLWSTRLAAQMAELPEFDGIFRAVQRAFRQAGLIG
jgi:hypothetical protein